MAEASKKNGTVALVAGGVLLFLILVYYFFIRKPATTTNTAGKTGAPATQTNTLGTASSIITALSGLGTSIADAAGNNTPTPATTASTGTVSQSGSTASDFTVQGGIGSGGNVVDGAGNVVGQDNQDGTTYTTNSGVSQPYSVIGLG